METENENEKRVNQRHKKKEKYEKGEYEVSLHCKFFHKNSRKN